MHVGSIVGYFLHTALATLLEIFIFWLPGSAL